MSEDRTDYDRDVRRQATDDDALLRVAKARFQQAEEAEADYRKLALDDLRFLAGDQWPQPVEQTRLLDGRPCLTINRLPQFLRQITNDVRQNPPGLKVSAVGDGTDVETAKVLQGLLRHIEVQSDATAVYITALEAAATHGRGYFRVLTDYETSLGFEQKLCLKRIRNPFTVYMDPSCQELDYSDAQWGFVVETLSKDQFTAEYPDTQRAQMPAWTSTGDQWIEREQCRVAEYWYLQPERRTIALLPGGQVVRQADVPEGVTPLQTRMALIPVVYWCKLTGDEVLEGPQLWPGKYVPIIPVLGQEWDIDGKVDLSGIVRGAKDSQRMYNYWVSAETETIALAPRAPFIGVEGQFEGHEMSWRTANTRNWPYLEYKAKAIGGQPAPPPQRNVFEPPIQAISQARLMAADDLKATTGIYDAALGARSNETSGRAILSRQRESDSATYHYPYNLAIALRHAGRVLLDLIPSIYSQQRVMRIIGDDGDERQVTLNTPHVDERGVRRLYDVTSGTYDVIVATGPSFASKRQEAVEAMVQVSQAYPQLLQVAGDLFVKNMDWPGASDIAARLRKTIPPELLDEQGATPEEQVQQLQQAMQQMTQQLEALNAYAQQAEQQGQQAQQEAQQAQQQLKDKSAELALKQQEMQLKNDLDTQRLALDAQKLELERIKVLLEAQMADAQQALAEQKVAIEALARAAEADNDELQRNGAVRTED